MKKLAIIGASYLQEPLIRKAKEMGLETHVFAWQVGDIGEKIADYFYPISIVEKEQILTKCREINIDGICSIASDLAVQTVCFVAEAMNLTANSMHSAMISTNKHQMRMSFEKNNDPSPKSIQITSASEIEGLDLRFPVIVKPVDRSGSRGITKVLSFDELESAVTNAQSQGFEKAALIEEFATGKEYSVEHISWQGEHRLLAITQKYTTGAPGFIETAHIEPALLEQETVDRVDKIISHALDSLEIKYGASHSEIKISQNGDIEIIEIGARMGGDCIGSSLVQLSTGYDFLQAVIEVALGKKPTSHKQFSKAAAIRFVFEKEDVEILNKIKDDNSNILIESNVEEIIGSKVTDSSTRFGYYIFADSNRDELVKYLPVQPEE